MSSDKKFVDYVVEQLRDAGSIRSKKMFGEYGLYCDEVFFAVICDDSSLLKSRLRERPPIPLCPRRHPMRGPRSPFW